MNNKKIIFELVCLSALMLSACGGKGNKTNSQGSQSTTPPTSETTSSSQDQSSGDTSTSSSTSSEPEHVHNYEFSSFIWTKTPGAYTAVARYICAADDEYQDHDATVTKTSTNAAECEADGQIVWHAEYDGHEENQYETLTALGHQWGEPTWQWSGLHAQAVATFTCTRNEEHQHQETATVENGGIVLHEHVDETCTIDGHDIYRATVTFEGKTYTDDRIENIPATEHSDVDEHGFCEGCGQYQGTELDDPDLNTEFASLSAGAYFYRFAINNEAVYKKVVHNIPAIEVLLFGLRNDAWEEIVLNTGSYSEIEDTDDGYAYVVLNLTATVENAYFRFDMDCIHNAHLEDHVDQYGFCTKCHEYTGRTAVIGTQYTQSITAGGYAFWRFEDPGSDYELKRTFSTDKFSASDFTFYRMSDGHLVNVTIDGTFRHVNASDDGYYYLVIHCDTEVLNGTFSIEKQTAPPDWNPDLG